jgi:hypothetical protein
MDLLMPLLYFYAQQDRSLPEIHFITGAEMPEPDRHLLVHDADMTPRLRSFHGCPITLSVVQAEHAADYVMRQVVLRRASDHAPVEYGAIGIHLDGFPAEVRALIASGAAPLGGILEEAAVPHRSAPHAYFEVRADAHIAMLLNCAEGSLLHGRCNALSFPDGIVFADIVEILPPGTR